MDWTLIQSMIRPELAGVVAVCWIIGYGLKRTAGIRDWMIIYFVTAAGIVFAGFTAGWTADGVMQGIFCGAVAVYGNQLVKQTAQALRKEDAHD
ncbi:phage holin family protein [Paenibacillus pasadenensis]|uniref:phage holin family protein n=1 Tax=Paenibacillus pasadenensis TaxID=217090 RepID=UPI0004057629|nr:phage holin family protein [Paenibacillus pasadenensis]